MENEIIGISFFILIFVVMPALVLIDKIKNEDRYMDWYRGKYRYRLNRFNDSKSLLLEAKNELAERYQKIVDLRHEIELLNSQKDLTEKEIFSVIERLNNYGLVNSNRSRYFRDITIGFITGTLASVFASWFWGLINN